MADKEALLKKIQTDLANLPDPEYHWVLKKAALSRPWRPKRKSWKGVLDQILHAGYSALLLSPILILNSLTGALLVGLLAGTIREIEQYFNQDLKIKMVWDRVIDILFFVIGAGLIYLIMK